MSSTVNGINVNDLQRLAQQVADDPAKGIVRFSVSTKWETAAWRPSAITLHEVATRTAVNLANFSKPIRLVHQLGILEA